MGPTSRLSPLYARTPKGERAHGSVPRNRGKNTTRLSSFEETFSKVKAFLRRVGARMHEALQEAIGQALETVTAQDAHGWFTHCGYLPSQEKKA